MSPMTEEVPLRSILAPNNRNVARFEATIVRFLKETPGTAATETGTRPAEHRQQGKGSGEEGERARRRPSVVHSPVQPVDQEQQSTRDRGGAKRVEMA